MVGPDERSAENVEPTSKQPAEDDGTKDIFESRDSLEGGSQSLDVSRPSGRRPSSEEANLELPVELASLTDRYIAPEYLDHRETRHGT